MSSGEAGLVGFVPVCPGGCLVVGGAGLEAAVKDADEAVGEAAEGVVVLVSAGALLVVEGACAEGDAQGGEGLGVEGVDEAGVVDEPGGDEPAFPGGAGDGAGGGVVLAGLAVARGSPGWFRSPTSSGWPSWPVTIGPAADRPPPNSAARIQRHLPEQDPAHIAYCSVLTGRFVRSARVET
jgi:hypothetical protein